MHVVSTLKPGGIEVFLSELFRRSDPNEMEMSICSLSGSGPLEGAFYDKGAVFRFPYRTPSIPSLILYLAQLFRAEKVEVVHSHIGAWTAWVAIAARLAGVPLVVATYHNTYRYRRPKLAKMFLQCARALATRQTAVSRAVVAWLEKHYGLRGVSVTYPGVDTEKFAPRNVEQIFAVRRELGLSAGTPIVGTVGALSAQKDPGTFLRAARAVAASSPRGEVCFLVVGDGEMREELKVLAHQLGLNSAVRFLGFRQDVDALMAAMDVFMLTSRWEGLGIVLLEAQASCLPVVASRVDGICEAVVEGETALLVDVGAEAAFANGVLQFLGNPELGGTCGRKGRAFVKRHFDLGDAVERYQSLYRPAQIGR